MKHLYIIIIIWDRGILKI